MGSNRSYYFCLLNDTAHCFLNPQGEGRIVFVSPSGLDGGVFWKEKRTACKGFAHNMAHLVSTETAVCAIPAKAYIAFFGLKGQAGKLTRCGEKLKLYYFSKKPYRQVLVLCVANSQNSLFCPKPFKSETTEI